METKSIKSLSERLLQGNCQGNQRETLSFLDGNQGRNQGDKQLEKLNPLLIKWKTRTGRDIYLITSERIRRMAPEGKAVFSLAELEKMRGLPSEAVDRIIDAKEVFPNAEVE